MRTAIRDDFVEKSEAEEDFVEKEGGNSFGGDGFLGRAKNYPLSKPMVYHDHERIEARGYGKIHDEIARDLLEGAGGDGFNGGQGGHGRVRVGFVLLAKGTALDIAAYKGGEAGPPEFSGDQLASFQEAGVPGGFMVMAPFKDGASEGIICRDVDTALVREDAGLNLPVGELGAEGEWNVFMHGLEGLEDEGITHRSGLDVVGEGVGAGKEFSGNMDHFQVEIGEID